MPVRPLLLVVALLAATGCAESELDLRFDRPGPATPTPEARTDADEVVAAALADLEAYWGEAIDELYDVRFEPLRGGYVPYGPATALPRCGTQELTYEQIADNALYCPAEDLIAWDRTTLIPDLQQRFGPLTVGLVMAHEFAHAVQNRADTEGATVTLELQADCFAGAWVADVDDRIDTFSTGDGALDQAVAGLLELRDTLGVPSYDPMAHGSGFDRVGAFQQGFEQGLEACASYEEEPPTVVAIPWSRGDVLTGGNLPLDELVEPLLLDLESFFRGYVQGEGGEWDPVDHIELFDPADGPIRCGDVSLGGDELESAAFHCASDDTHYLDATELVPALEEIGDFAFGGEVARLHASAAQAQLGLRGDDATALGLHADCLAGAFSEFEFTIEDGESQELFLSPGDLDEVVVAFLAFGAEEQATAFERTAAFRTGFVDGTDACHVYLG